MVTFPVNLGKMISVYRKKNNLSRPKFADKIHVSASLIRDIEKGRHENVTLATLSLILEELGVLSITLSINESLSQDEYKEKIIKNINAPLYLEDPRVLKVLEDSIDLEIAKIKRTIHSLEDPEQEI